MSKELEALTNIGAIFVSCICNEDGDIDYCHLRDHNDYINWYNTVEQALKRNEPMKVVFFRSPSYYGYGYYACPNCEQIIIEEHYNYCPDCGHELGWSNDEN